ncbi:hypothetical protein [Candidatus Magnetominusculus dajiuhuensis]|uniref:hypothetical protein n=1 Tax=Candidatus Magnetominusculus dajiuhuensis TaxID=3137712 RepID=UPI003B42BE11
MPNEYLQMPVESISSIVGPRAVETSSMWAKRDNGKKKTQKAKRKAAPEKGLIDILV